MAVCFLHAQLPCVAWAARGSGRIGYVQTGGGALPGSHSRVVAELLERGLLAGHICAAPSFGGGHDAITTIGGLHAGLTELGWDAAIAGPGPGILGSASALGHGGMAALDSAHAALALGCQTILVPRMSSGRRPRPPLGRLAPHADRARPGPEAGRGGEPRRRGPARATWRAACPPPRWGAPPRRTPRSSWRRSRAGGCSRRRSGRNPAVGFERIASEVVYSGQDRHRLQGHGPLRRRRGGGGARVRGPPRLGRDGRPRRRARVPRQPAARAGGRAAGARAAGRQARRRGREPARHREARAGGGDREVGGASGSC